MKKKGVWEFLEKENPDIICIQESKAQEKQVKEFLEKEKKDFNDKKKDTQNINFFENYKYQYWNSAEKKGYSGTIIFSKEKPVSIKNGIGDNLDNEGRVITIEYEKYFVVNVYTPNSKPDLSRVDYRKDTWDKNFLKHLKKLEKKKPIIACGDFNVAYAEIDLKNPQSNKTTEKKPGSAGFTDKERKSFKRYFDENFIDVFRFLFPDKIKYSWFSYRAKARERNTGWRIDYFLVSGILKEKIKNSEIFSEITGSDHSPISLDVSIK